MGIRFAHAPGIIQTAAQLLRERRLGAIQPLRHYAGHLPALLPMSELLQNVVGDQIELISRPSTSLWPVEADPTHIQQVIMNLAINARDAMPDGGSLRIETANVELDESFVNSHPDARSGPHVKLTVSDTGTGMDEDTLSHVFEPFYTTKEVGKGTGLGLATVHGIVNRTGGSIWVYSELGEGTSFKVYIPQTEKE